MSPARMPRFAVTKTSTQSCGSRTHCIRGCTISSRHRSSQLAVSMLLPHLRCGVLQLDRLLQQRIIPVPLDEIRPTHEGSMLRGAAVVVPQVEVEKVHRI